ncbi:MYLK2 kinase, partial [Penelope pileata]|nr:MYLK2 kinase [Penelope pileata]
MEQHGTAGSPAGTGGSGSTAPPGAEPGAALSAPAAEPAQGKVLNAAQGQDGGKGEATGKAPTAGESQAGTAEPAQGKVPAQDAGREKHAEEKAPGAAAQAQDEGEKAAGEPHGEKAEPAQEAAPAAAQPGDGGGKEHSTEQAAAAELRGGQAEPTQGMGPTAAPGQDGGKEQPPEQKAPGVPGAEAGGKSEPTKKASAAAEAAGGTAQTTKTAQAAAQDGAGEEHVKEKGPAAASTEDGGQKAAKAEKSPAGKKPAKEKGPAAVKGQDGEKKVAKAEKAPAAAKAPSGGKEAAKEKAPAAAKAPGGGKEPVKEKATSPAKEKATDTAKEKPAAAAEAQGGGKKPAGEALPAAEAQGDGEKAAHVEQAQEQQPPKGSEPTRPALMQSLSCPATCQREEQPRLEVAVMEMIPEETTVAPTKEGPAEPTPTPGDVQPPAHPVPAGSTGVPQERTLQPQPGSEPPGHAEPPGPGAAEQPSSAVAEPPQSPYLTPDFGKEDPFEILDDVPPPPAPFAHRIVTLHTASISSQYNLSSKDILGGGKFGEVHTCTEKQTGLKLAAKVIRKQGAKDKEMVLLEIDVMNQLNHRNLIQLYDAIETPREIVLFMEFVEGGELFERIIDDDYHLTEVDCMVFVRQICEGIRFMHHMRVLHLDLKPENILCVAATGHMVKIIDFGLARRYNPQEKLKVNFGTPEFLSPEVVNYEQVSYSTDMWSMGVITYMLLSGLSPFLGDNDTETLNNVLAANWYFDEETFESVSDEAKDFVSNLIIKEKSARLSAGQCLQHPWLNNLAEKAKRCNRRLKSQVLLKKYVMRRRWKKNFIGVCAANRFRKITSSGSLTALGV